ncbi:MAG: hypothetical protein ACRDJC_21595 [Thermomicrobiales bacterium]
MDKEIFDRLTRLFDRSDTRRAALSTLLGSALLGTTLGTASAKPQPYGQDKPNGTGKAKGQGKRRRKRQGRVSAEGNNKKNKPGNHCINPGGVDLNELYGISAQIVAPPFFQGCSEVGAGEQWVNTISWLMEHTFVAVPAGFVRAGDTPLEDFIAKFEGVRYVIDPDTKHEKSVVIPNSDTLFIGEDEFEGAIVVLVSPGTLGTVHPLPVGEHEFDLYWKFSAMHCDGIAAVIGENCLSAGETQFIDGLPFTVVPGHN